MRSDLAMLHELLDSKAPNTVWHYTDAAACLGILQSRTLWLSSVRMMNDAEELEFGQRIVDEVWKEARADFNDPDLMDYVLVALRKALDDRAYYAICASLDDRSLSQFRAYGSYAIGIDTSVGLEAKLTDDQRENGSLNDEFEFFPDWTPVVYEPESQRALARRFLKLIEECAPYFGRPAEGLDEDAIRQANFTARMLYLMTISSFKNKFFQEEREIRLLCQIKLASPAVHFRVSAYGLLPYLELTPEVAQPPSELIEGINIGPNVVDGVAAEWGLTAALEKFGWSDVKVEVLGQQVR